MHSAATWSRVALKVVAGKEGNAIDVDCAAASLREENRVAGQAGAPWIARLVQRWHFSAADIDGSHEKTVTEESRLADEPVSGT